MIINDAKLEKYFEDVIEELRTINDNLEDIRVNTKKNVKRD